MIISCHGCIIWDKVILADSVWLRLKGLLGRKSLAQGEGLILVPCRQVHGLFMHIPLDLVFLDRAGCVLKVSRLQPWQISPNVLAAHSILEVAAGSAAKISPGDILDLTSR